jgi:SAM-dependent methyltransferase
MLRFVRFKKRPAQVTYERGVPPPEINYNQEKTSDHAAYVRAFKQDACLRELPFLMRAAGLKPGSVLLDYGCGLGRLAYAASKYLDDTGAYFGYEPNQTALNFLRSAYAGRKNFFFDGQSLAREEDYVAIERREQREGGITAQDVELSRLVNRPVDIQWSCSVFTHMWSQAIVNVLNGITKTLCSDGVCVNTWLCIDEFATYALKCGVADRALPFEINGVRTYSEKNPLVCAAYDLATVREIYRRGGHRIEDILWGSWSGRENGVIYQDIIISRPLR